MNLEKSLWQKKNKHVDFDDLTNLQENVQNFQIDKIILKEHIRANIKRTYTSQY